MEQISPDIIERSVVKCVQSVGEYYCDQKILDTNVIVLSYILKRPLCINNLNFDCVNFENVNVRFTEKIFKKIYFKPVSNLSRDSFNKAWFRVIFLNVTEV
jgi:hypothetical protein